MSVVGIDLGTTNTVVACVRNGRVHVIGDEQGRRLLPSVVSFHPNGEVLVGHAAKQRRMVDAKNTIASVKRLLGRPWNSPELTKARARFAFDMKEGPGQGPIVVARGKEFTLPEISAFVLKRAREIAETQLGERVERAVITVPAHFNELQRAATKVAGRVAGLEVLRILNEPTAAALAYGLGKGSKERIAIYDFGGGTFDATLLDLNGNVFEVLATAGDPFLGGDDVDDAIAERMSDAFLMQHRFDPRTDPQAFERLRQAAEQLKMNLSSGEQQQVHLREIAFGAGGAHLDLTFGLTRAELEKMTEPLVERTFRVTQDALALARLAPSEFDRTILVGGSSRMPLVRRRVEAFFGAAPMDRMNPDEVVAIGAAIQAAALTDASRRRGIPPPPGFTTRKSAPSFAEFNEAPPSSTRLPSTSMTSDLDDEAETQSMHRDSVLPSSPPSSSKRDAPSTQRGLSAPPPAPVPTTTARMAPVPTTTTPMRQATPAPPAPPRAGSSPMIVPAATARGSSPGITPLAQPFPPPAPQRLQQPPTPQAMAPVARPPTPGYAMPPGARPFGMIEEPSLGSGFGGIIPPAQRPPPPSAGALPSASRVPNAAPQGRPGSQPDLGRYQSQPPTPPVFTQSRPPPVLIDVTPRALVVETAGGWCDTVIPRNAKIPCEMTRVFATAQDGQQVVRVRVAQGEEPSFPANTYLGELELTGIRAAPRGEVSVSVTFELDADGTLRVRARDSATGKQATAALQLTGIAQEAEIEAMQRRMSAVGGILSS